MNRYAVFIDRDGVINYDPGHFHKIEELKILPRVGLAIHLLNEYKIPAIVVTNQSVVAKGWITENEVVKIHNKVERVIAKDGAKINKFYYCPHHPEAVLPKYRTICNCRKPATGLFEKAIEEFNIDIKSSYVIGDSYREIESAKKLGCKSIAVECGSSEFKDSKPDYRVKDLCAAVKLILSYKI